MLKKVAFAAALAVAASTTVDAASLEVYSNYTFGFYGEVRSPSNRKTSVDGPISVAHVAMSPTSAANATLSGSAYADYGVLKVATGLALTSGSASSGSFARWFDEATITTTEGGFGTALVSILVDGAVSGSVGTYSGNTTAMISFASSLSRTTQFDLTSQLSISGLHNRLILNGQISNPAQIGTTYLVEVPFFSGSQFSMNMSALCGSGATGSDWSVACELGHSVYWNGLVAVKTSSGAEATLTSFTSASGTDYTKSAYVGGVPEPASWTMMVVGSGLMGSAMRRRKVAVSFA